MYNIEIKKYKINFQIYFYITNNMVNILVKI